MSSSTSVEFGEWLVKWHSDLGRTLDNLQSRPEEFGRTFTRYGIRYGANQQVPLIVMDDRISSAVLLVGG